MIYTFKITLSGIKGFFRIYQVDGSHSLYSFHKQIRADLEFPVDQPILFKAFDAENQLLARYALVDLGFGTVDEISIADTVKLGVNSFVYFYDVRSKKSVIITLEKQEEGHIGLPTLLESKGPIPLEFENGYVAFEDLPEEKKKLPGDEDDEDEEEDDDDENYEDEDEYSEEEEVVYEEE